MKEKKEKNGKENIEGNISALNEAKMQDKDIKQEKATTDFTKEIAEKYYFTKEEYKIVKEYADKSSLKKVPEKIEVDDFLKYKQDEDGEKDEVYKYLLKGVEKTGNYDYRNCQSVIHLNTLNLSMKKKLVYSNENKLPCVLRDNCVKRLKKLKIIEEDLFEVNKKIRQPKISENKIKIEYNNADIADIITNAKDGAYLGGTYGHILNIWIKGDYIYGHDNQTKGGNVFFFRVKKSDTIKYINKIIGEHDYSRYLKLDGLYKLTGKTDELLYKAVVK